MSVILSAAPLLPHFVFCVASNVADYDFGSLVASCAVCLFMSQLLHLKERA